MHITNILLTVQYIKIQLKMMEEIEISEEEVNKKKHKLLIQKVKIIIKDKNKQSDIFNKSFLKPMQVALKTWKTQGITNPKYYDSLPFGLKQAIKKDISENAFELLNFQSYGSLSKNQKDISRIRQKNMDNLLSLIKPYGQEKKIKVCICICMYSQDKTALRKTLAGVSRNIQTFIDNGISSDEIIVAVVQDGIQKVDSSVVQFFQQLQKQSDLYLDQQIEDDIMKELYNQDPMIETQIRNVNSFVFTSQQFAERKKRRFSNRKKQYEQTKKLKKKVQQLQLKQNLTLADLDLALYKFFLQRGRQKLRQMDVQLQYIKYFDSQSYMQNKAAMQNGEKVLKTQQISDQQIIQFYENNSKRCRQVLQTTLQKAKQYCTKYIQTRDQLCLINCFRVDFSVGSFVNRADPDDDDQQLQKISHLEQRPDYRVNLIFMTKYKNGGKLSSHNWFFNGLCKQIQSQFAVLLDVGLCPDQTALYKMCKHMQNNPRCGGVCGYMMLRIQKLQQQDQSHLQKIDWFSRVLTRFADIQRVQQVEYHFAHLIDKPFEALFQFIHVLPGAYSAYRMQAFQPKVDQQEKNQNKSMLNQFDSSMKVQAQIMDEGNQHLMRQDSKLMKQYFKSLQQSTERQLAITHYSPCKTLLKILLPDFVFYWCFPRPAQMSDQQLLYNSNVYFAQDRTLCLGIHQNGYTLDYLPDALAWVDPIKNLHGLLGQRKRWINGSFFAFQSVKTVLLYKTLGQCCLKLQILYFALMNIISFASPAFFLFAVHNSMFVIRDWFFGVIVFQNMQRADFQTNQFFNSFVYVMDTVFIFLLIGLIFKSMHFTHRSQKFIPFVYGLSTLFGLFSLVAFIILLTDVISGIIDTFRCIGKDMFCSITYLVQQPDVRQRFFNSLPGGLIVFFTYKWLVVGVISLYFIPIMIYCLSFCKLQIIFQIILGIFSFIFYTPTYVIILTTFSLCRIDDISWGTKGLDAGNSRGKQLIESWKSIKIILVGKYIFWNVIIGSILIVFNSPIYVRQYMVQITSQGTQEQIQNLKDLKNQQQLSQLINTYVRRFYFTFAFMILVFLTLFLRIFLGAIYSIVYRIRSGCTSKIPQQTQSKNNRSKIEQYFNEIKSSVYEQIQKQADEMIKDYENKNNIGLTSAFGFLISAIKSQKTKGKIEFKRPVDQKAQIKKEVANSARNNVVEKKPNQIQIKPQNSQQKMNPLVVSKSNTKVNKDQSIVSFQQILNLKAPLQIDEGLIHQN